MNATAKYLNKNITNYFNKDQIGRIITPLILITSSIGLPLNGIVIWLLGFWIKRNPFTGLILNLAISDFGVLIFMPIASTPYCRAFIQSITHRFALFCVADIMYMNGLFLLTAISIDQCVAVLFPIWHRCSHPKYLFPAACAFLWTISFLSGNSRDYGICIGISCHQNLHLLVTALLCLPWITISTVVLFINIKLRPKQIKHGRLLVMILITLFCFLILSLPLYIYIFIAHFLNMSYVWHVRQFPLYFGLCACLNSSINPVIYFLVGGKKRARTRESIKVMFQRVFAEDEAPETR